MRRACPEGEARMGSIPAAPTGGRRRRVLARPLPHRLSPHLIHDHQYRPQLRLFRSHSAPAAALQYLAGEGSARGGQDATRLTPRGASRSDEHPHSSLPDGGRDEAQAAGPGRDARAGRPRRRGASATPGSRGPSLAPIPSALLLPTALALPSEKPRPSMTGLKKRPYFNSPTVTTLLA